VDVLPCLSLAACRPTDLGKGRPPRLVDISGYPRLGRFWFGLPDTSRCRLEYRTRTRQLRLQSFAVRRPRTFRRHVRRGRSPSRISCTCRGCGDVFGCYRLLVAVCRRGAAAGGAATAAAAAAAKRLESSKRLEQWAFRRSNPQLVVMWFVGVRRRGRSSSRRSGGAPTICDDDRLRRGRRAWLS
jgi:hypothetical protein